MENMTKDQALENFKEHLKNNASYMGVGSAVLELLESNKLASFMTSGLVQEIYQMEDELIKLRAEGGVLVRCCSEDERQAAKSEGEKALKLHREKRAAR